MENNIFIFRTFDNCEFRLPSTIINMLNYINEHINGIFINNLEITDNCINLGTIKSSEFEQIILFCDHHNHIHPPEIIRPLQYNDLKLCVKDPWDADFISQFDFNRVTELLSASELLKCSSLADLCYARLALYFRRI